RPARESPPGGAMMPLLTMIVLLALPPHPGPVTPPDGAKDVSIRAEIVVHVLGTDGQPTFELTEASTGVTVEGRLQHTARWPARPASAPPRPPGWIDEYREDGTYTFVLAKPLKPRTKYQILFMGTKTTFTTGDAKEKEKEKEKARTGETRPK